MKNSKPGKGLDPNLKAAVDAIYLRDTMRYCAIARWVWWAQKQGWPDEAIAEACRMAVPGVHSVASYWPYLTKLLSKAKAKATAKESDKHKSEVGELAMDFVEFVKARRKANG